MRLQDWAFLLASVGLVLTLAAAWLGHFLVALLLAVVTIGAGATARMRARQEPGPMAAAIRWVLHFPRGPNSPASLARLLNPRSGERILDVGAGIGIHALPIARRLLPDGRLDALDAQQSMLDALSRRAEASSLKNVSAVLANAEHLPYPDHTFDGAYLITVLGEIPSPAAALRELARVLKPDGRLVIGEMIIDPDFIAFEKLKEQTEAAGFTCDDRRGPGFVYLARFRPNRDAPPAAR